MPRLAAETRVARRQQLIDAAWRSVADRGFQSLTVDEVCVEAGVSKGAFYLYFESKQDLLLGLLEDEAAEIDAFMADLERADLGGVERLRRFTRVMIERGDDPARLQIRADLWSEMSASTAVREKWVAVVRARRGCSSVGSRQASHLASWHRYRRTRWRRSCSHSEMGCCFTPGWIHPASGGATSPKPSMRSWTG